MNIKDYEKMSREFHTFEFDIQAPQYYRNEWEERDWEVKVSMSKKLKNIEAIVDHYN